MFSTLVTGVQAQTFDEVYGVSEQRYDSYNKKKRQQQVTNSSQDPDDENSYTNSNTTTAQRSYITDEDELIDYNQSSVDEFQYATRIRRFCTPMFGAGYFSRFYWDPYWWDWNYTYPSWYTGFGWGMNPGFGWGFPSFGWGNPGLGWGYSPWHWNGFTPGFGWGNQYPGWGCGFGGWGNFYGGYYGGWGGFNPGWGFGNGFNNYWNGFYDGYWSNMNYPNGNGYSYGPRRGLNSTSGMQNGRREYTPRDRSLTMDNMPNAYRGNNLNATQRVSTPRNGVDRVNNTIRTQNPGYNPNAGSVNTRENRNLNERNRNERFNNTTRENNINNTERFENNRGGNRFNQENNNGNTERFQNNRNEYNQQAPVRNNNYREQESTPNNNGRFNQRETQYNMQSAPMPAPQSAPRREQRATPPPRETRIYQESAPSRSNNPSTPRSSMPSSPRMSMPSAPSGGGGGGFRGGRR